MTKDDFFNLLTEEVKTYKNFLETANNECKLPKLAY